MMNILLFIQVVIAMLLIIVILLQKTSSDGLSGIGGGNNMGLVSSRSAANFLIKTTIVLASLFFVNAIVLANLSTRKNESVEKKLEIMDDKEKPEQNAVPIAK